MNFPSLNKKLLVSLLVVFNARLYGQAEKGPIIIAADTWCPYTCADGQNFDGFAVEIVSEALKMAKIGYQYKNASFDRIEELVEKGNWQISVATDKFLTPRLLISKESVAIGRYVYVALKNRSIKINQVADLQKLVLGVASGYFYSKKLMDYITAKKNAAKVSMVSSSMPHKLNLLKLKNGRIDVYLEDERVVKYWAKELKMDQEIEVVGIDTEYMYFNGLKNKNKESKKLLKRIDNELQSFKKTEKFTEIMQKYAIPESDRRKYEQNKL